MSLLNCVSVFSETNLSGKSFWTGCPMDSHYAIWPSYALMNKGLYRNIRSARLLSSPLADTTLLLFLGAPSIEGQILDFTEFTGSFLQITNAQSGNPLDLPVLGPFTTALAVIAPHQENKREFRISARDEFVSQLNNLVSANLSDSPAQLVGAPIITLNIDLDRSTLYWYFVLQVCLPLKVDYFTAHYDASITLDTRLFVLNHTLECAIYFHSVWAEDGYWQGKIENELETRFVNNLSSINRSLQNAIDTEMQKLGSPKLQGVYLLPGKQSIPGKKSDLIPAGTPGFSGPAGMSYCPKWDDVTIVFEL